MKSMNATVQTKLKQIVAQYGMSVIDEPLRCQGLLNDLCPTSKREVSSLILVLKEGIPLELMKSSRNAPRQAVVSRLVRQVTDNIGLSEDVARWAVESWSRALDSMDPAAYAKALATPSKLARVATPAAPVAKKAAVLKPPTLPKINWKIVSDTLQHPAVLLPMSLCAVSAVYLLFLSSLYGGVVAAVVLLMASGGLTIGLFISYYKKFRSTYAHGGKTTPPAPPNPPKATP